MLGFVDVGLAGNAECCARVEDRFGERAAVGLERNVKRSADAALAIAAKFVVIHLLEDRGHVAPAPTGTTVSLPAVVIVRMTAAIDHAVIALDPPTVRPRSHTAGRSALPGSGSVGKTQLSEGSVKVLPMPIGIEM